jgi:hypothetical protein
MVRRDEREEERKLLSKAKKMLFKTDPRFDFKKNRSIVYKTKKSLKCGHLDKVDEILMKVKLI